MWEMLAKELGKDAAIDVSMPKPRGEVLIAGRFYAPDGRSVYAGQVTAKVGEWEKKLFVFGDRYWKQTITGEWEIVRLSQISSLDLTWENAFGGPSFPQNPLGKGADELQYPDGISYISLPNIEYPHTLVVSPSDRPPPACFCPVDITWPQRASKAGTYDDKWLKELFPGFALDMDWTIFNIASEDQQIQGYFNGDETFFFENLHPDKPIIKGSLPRLRPRCFVSQESSDPQKLNEIKLHLDTLWFIPHIEKVLLIYRGVCEVADEDAQDIKTILLACEAGQENKRSNEFYKEALAKRLDSKTGYLNILDEKDLLPEGEPSAISELMKKDNDEKDIIMENMARKAEREKAKAYAMCEEYGIDPSLFNQESAEPEINLNNLSELPKIIKKQEQEALKQKEAMEKNFRKMAKEMGYDPDELLQNAKKNEIRWPKFSAKKIIEQLRAFGIEDSAKEAKLIEVEQNLSNSLRAAVHHLEPTYPREPGEIQEVKRRILNARETGVSLKDEDLAYADLSHMDLADMDFSYAYLEGANFSSANLQGANFKGAILVRCKFRKSNLKFANLDEANLGHSQIDEVDFSKASLKNAILSGAQIKCSTFVNSNMQYADLSNAQVTRSDFRQAVIRQGMFLETILSHTSFIEADISGSDFLYARLEQCDFSSAIMHSTTFVKAPAASSLFIKADLSGSCMADKCDFSKCDFSMARAVEVNFRGSNLSESCFKQTDVSGADFGQCIMKEADFTLALAKGTGFTKADLTNVRFRGANLMRAIFQQSILHYTDFTASNLFEANFIKAKFYNIEIALANTKRAFMDPWIKA